MEQARMACCRQVRKATHWLAILFLVPIIASCSRDESIVVASHVWLGYEPMFLAQSLGWLDPQRVQLSETAAATESLAALHAGTIDGAALTLDEVIQARAQGLDLRVVLVFNLSVGADVLLVRPPLTELSQLAGRRVGFEHGAVGHLLVAKALASVGMTLAEIDVVDVAIDAHQAAWDAGSVDALASYEPTASRLRAAGAVQVFDSSEVPTAIVDVLAFRGERLNATTRSALKHLVTAHLRAVDYLQNHPEDAAFRMARRLDLPVDQVLPSYRGLVLADLINNHRLMQGDPAILLESSRGLVNFKLANGLLEEHQDLDGLLEPRYLPRVNGRRRP